MERFQNREEAGQRLAEAVAALGLADPVVLALPRGGVPVAKPVADRLDAPLDLILVRKIGAPLHEELAVGAVVEGHPPDVVWNHHVLDQLRLETSELEATVARKLEEIEARRSRYMGARAPLSLQGRDAVVVDDGIATGATVRAALKALRRRNPASITLAVPVAPPEMCDRLGTTVDHLICLSQPEAFFAVGAHYVDFRQTTDDEVTRLLECKKTGNADT